MIWADWRWIFPLGMLREYLVIQKRKEMSVFHYTPPLNFCVGSLVLMWSIELYMIRDLQWWWTVLSVYFASIVLLQRPAQWVDWLWCAVIGNVVLGMTDVHAPMRMKVRERERDREKWLLNSWDSARCFRSPWQLPTLLLSL